MIVRALRREYGLVFLVKNHDPDDRRNAYDEFVNWFRSEKDADRVLDAIEVTFRMIVHFRKHGDYLRRERADRIFDGAIDELNGRFKESAVGYQFTDGQIVRVDSAFVHAEAVIPALTVLRQPEFVSAQKEFLGAFEHFRHGNKAEVLVDCCKAFESTMKVICDKRGWSYPSTATASVLVKTCLDNGLIPSYWQSHFTGLRSVLESAIPTPRNKQAGHGGWLDCFPRFTR